MLTVFGFLKFIRLSVARIKCAIQIRHPLITCIIASNSPTNRSKPAPFETDIHHFAFLESAHCSVDCGLRQIFPSFKTIHELTLYRIQLISDLLWRLSLYPRNWLILLRLLGCYVLFEVRQNNSMMSLIVSDALWQHSKHFSLHHLDLETIEYLLNKISPNYVNDYLRGRYYLKH